MFLSDGQSNFGGSTFDESGRPRRDGGHRSLLRRRWIRRASGTAGTLRPIAVTTGGSCTHVSDPATLAEVIAGLLSSTLDSLELSIDGGAPGRDPQRRHLLPLPQDGPVSVTYSTPVANLGLGEHTLCVTAFGTGAGEVGNSGPACTKVSVFAIELNPPHAERELGVDTSYTVTATIFGETSSVDGRMVTFTVISGPNAGTSGSCTVAVDCTTDADGKVSWTYFNSGAGGTDTIRACFTVATPTGQTGCDTATVRWADTTPPLAACLPGPNPHGKHIPPAGNSSLPGPKGGQNEDGFYDLMAEDAVDPNPQVFAVDEGTDHVFGPYPAGTIVKWTQAPGAPPAEKKMGSDKGKAGAVDYHLGARATCWSSQWMPRVTPPIRWSAWSRRFRNRRTDVVALVGGRDIKQRRHDNRPPPT